jgi:hypothetical protein
MKDQAQVLDAIVKATRKTFAIREGELKGRPDISDVVQLPELKIRTDELPKVVVFGIAEMYRIDRSAMEQCSPLLIGDTRQQNTFRLDQLRRKWHKLIEHSSEDLPGVRRAMIAVSLTLRNMSESSTILKIKYNE